MIRTKQKSWTVCKIQLVHAECYFVQLCLHGMGVDIPDIQTVIHYGPSADVDEYLQEAGPAGRDGTARNAILYCYLGCTLGHVSPAMKRYTMNDDTCRRSLLLQSFGRITRHDPAAQSQLL